MLCCTAAMLTQSCLSRLGVNRCTLPGLGLVICQPSGSICQQCLILPLFLTCGGKPELASTHDRLQAMVKFLNVSAVKCLFSWCHAAHVAVCMSFSLSKALAYTWSMDVTMYCFSEPCTRHCPDRSSCCNVHCTQSCLAATICCAILLHSTLALSIAHDTALHYDTHGRIAHDTHWSHCT